MQKGKMVEEALQIAEKRSEAKSKGEKERYTHLNAEFQRITRRDKKASLSDQCGEGNGNQFQYSCLENPKDRGAWLAAVHGVVKIFFVQFFCLFLPPLLNIFCFC